MENNDFDDEHENDFDLKAILYKYLIHWKWFVLAICIGLAGAFSYLRYAIPQYNVRTTILVKDDKKGSMLSELSAFADLGMGAGMQSNLDNEIEILKSRTLVESTVRKLNLNTTLFVAGKISDSEIYGDTPISVNFMDKSNGFYQSSIDLNFTEISPTSFELVNQAENDSSKIIIGNKKEFLYEKPIMTKYGALIISKLGVNGRKQSTSDKSIRIVVRPLENVVQSFQGRLKVEPVSKTSSVVALSITGPVIKSAEDFLNNLTVIYNEDAAADKNFISENTSIFIANRLKLITQELDGVEQDVQSFKKSNQVTDIASEAQIFIEGSNEYDKKGVETEIQLNMVSSMLNFLKQSTNADLLPTNIISGDASAAGMIKAYNQLVLDRNRILKSATEVNPSVVKMNQEISSLKNYVQGSLQRMRSNLNIQKRNLNSEENILNAKIGKIPAQERQFRVIARQQKVKEELYLYLLQKREETAISLAATEPNARVIDEAKGNKSPVSPKGKIIYLAGLLMGLLVPFGVLYLIFMLDNKIHSANDVEAKSNNIPILAEIPSAAKNSTDAIQNQEAFRTLAQNTSFIGPFIRSSFGKVLLVTSSIKDEGKTYVSCHLADAYANLDKKVLLVGADLRNPQLHKQIDSIEKESKGLSNYLHNPNLQWQNLVSKIKYTEFSFDVLEAGAIPPNPSLLLSSSRFNTLIEEAKKEYDIIILDTPPTLLVSDTLIISEYADTTLYVLRAEITEKNLLTYSKKLGADKKLINMGYVINDVNINCTYGYNYGYGYGYGKEAASEPWYRKSILGKLFSK